MADTDKRIRYNEYATGTGHPERVDSLNRLANTFHDNTGRHKWSGGSNVASASSISVPDDENYFIVTGTTTVAGIAGTTSGGSSIATGVTVKVKFSGNLTLTHNATSFIMPQGKDCLIAANDFVEFIHLGSGNWALTANSAVDHASSGSYRNLRVINNVTNPTYQIDVTADAITVHDDYGNMHEIKSFSDSVDLTVSGAGGLDTGSEANSTQYYLYVIFGTSGSNLLLSLSATAPTMPAGYTYKRRISSTYNDGSGDLLKLAQVDNHISMLAFVNYLTAGSAATATTVTPYQTSTVPLPATAIAMRGTALTNTANALFYLGYSTTAGYGSNIPIGGAASDFITFNIILNTSQQHTYLRSSGTGTVTLYCSGWYEGI
ncbi:MAG: hypothetical protein OEY10_00355 [Nitrosopumilus sp.]|nr:hypothetical protein [Nitrosopumilus sp.]